MRTMKMKPPAHLLGLTFALAGLLAIAAASASAPTATRYLITNDDNSQANTASFYTIGTGGKLTRTAVVSTGGFGRDGLGYAATTKIVVSHDTLGDCAYLSDSIPAGIGIAPDVAAINISTLASAGLFKGSSTDQATTLGMGVAQNHGYVYANFTDSKTIGTYKRRAGCTLQFIKDTPASGVTGYPIIGMAVNNSILVATFEDGSIESFKLVNGVPVSNGDLQVSNGQSPSPVDITADGHYAIFGDSGSTVEVSDISSGKLAPTVVYSGLGPSSIVGDIRLSPDETLLYISNFSTGQVTAAFFDKTTGAVSTGCTSAVLRGFNHQFAWVAGLATALPSGTGSVVYTADPDVRISIVRPTISGGTCSFTEAPSSPVPDSSAATLESIAAFPPRSF
jgi:hypothetical protein